MTSSPLNHSLDKNLFLEGKNNPEGVKGMIVRMQQWDLIFDVFNELTYTSISNTS